MTSGQALAKNIALIAAVASLMGACATSGNLRDPIEGFNRVVFGFNEGVDKAVVKPVAKGYDTVVPSPVRTGVSNFFGNVADVFIAVNNLLQGKPGEAVGDAGRVIVNSTVGILGLFDVASEMGLEKHDEDFGQTFGRWGIDSGAYLVLPILGPSTMRDATCRILDIYADPVGDVSRVATRNALIVTRGVSDRAVLLPGDKVIEEAALDKYSYVRDFYLQRRRNLIYDGNPPREKEDDSAAEPPEKTATTPPTASAVAPMAPSGRDATESSGDR